MDRKHGNEFSWYFGQWQYNATPRHCTATNFWNASNITNLCVQIGNEAQPDYHLTDHNRIYYCAVTTDLQIKILHLRGTLSVANGVV